MPAKKVATPAKPAWTPAQNEYVIFNGYATVPDAPLLVEGEPCIVTKIETVKGKSRFHLSPIQADGDGNDRQPDTAFLQEIRQTTPEELEQIEAFVASGDTDDEDLEDLGNAADGGHDESIARLVELANAHGLDPEDAEAYPTYLALGQAIAALIAEAGGEGEEEQQEEETEYVSPYFALAESADAGDEAAGAELTELCTQFEINPESAETWVEIIALFPEQELEEEQAPEPEPVTPAAKKAAAKKAAANTAPAPATKQAKPATKAAKAPAPQKSKIRLTPALQALLTENGNNVMEAMQNKESETEGSLLDLGGLICLGQATAIHLSVMDENGKPKYDDSAKGYFTYVSDNLSTDVRNAQYYAKVYKTFIHSLKYAPEEILPLGMTKLRVIAPIAGDIAKADKAADKARAEELKLKLTDLPEAERSALLNTFLQEAHTMTVKETTARVQAYRAEKAGGDGSDGGGNDPLKSKLTMLSFQLFEDEASWVKGVLETVKATLPDERKNGNQALLTLVQDYAVNAGIPAYVAKAAPAKPATKQATKTATKTAKPAPAPAKKAAKKVAAK